MNEYLLIIVTSDRSFIEIRTVGEANLVTIQAELRGVLITSNYLLYALKVALNFSQLPRAFDIILIDLFVAITKDLYISSNHFMESFVFSKLWVRFEKTFGNFSVMNDQPSLSRTGYLIYDFISE